ncbi:unnamed protein product [Miscanthus lutarioriparius]|uniref:SEC7 domain-containing protein n=1 Tax=Miscanthus lutarioriparius TaxID=422564 RepID=A0A811SDD0_9POAL|nr:unnamed protein product [Miscanthus lutarioriparius]
MSSSEPDAEGALGGSSPSARVLARALDKIIKHSSWRRHAALVAASKSALDLLSSSPAPDDGPDTSSPSPVPGLPAPAADAALAALILALDPASPKVAEPALECVAGLLSLRLLLGDVDAADPSPVSNLFAAVLSCVSLGGGGDEALELAVLRVLVAFARCPGVSVSGECLGQVVKACYNVYLGSASGGNQLCAKLALAQVLVIVFTRVEADAMDVRVRTVSAADMMDLSDRSLNDSSVVQAAQFGTPDSPEDPMLLRGKVLSLELVRMVIDNAGPFWKTNEKYLEAVKQYLCLSLLKNSALSAMSVFQLLCSIFMSLISRFRSGLKEEIGMFFPMLILRVLENVLQPSFLQKMTVLNFLEKISKEPQVVIDIFVNFDCDVDAPNIFERIINGLLKTALGVPTGSTTTLTVAQDQTFRIESVKCLATVVKSMGAWMDQQLRIGEFSPGSSETLSSAENHNIHNGEEGSGIDYELQLDTGSSDITDSSSLEQRRAYKIELQKGITLFNKKPSKGIDFLIRSKKIGNSPEDVASFLRNTAGLNATMIGDYLGERDDFPLKVMHAYVDALNFEGMDFGQAIRFFLQGFRLPGEAQKIDRIMEKFAQCYCKCNPNAFTSADTAYVLAYSVILLNTDAHNPTVKNKMSKADFMRNNRGIDDGKDLPEDYLSTLYDQIVNNEIKMTVDSSVAQTKQSNSVGRLLGLDNIINFVNWRSAEDKAVGANDLLIKHIQEKFKAKRGKSESTFYVVADATILRFMMESCWAPMMAAFSVLLDQCDDKAATSQCLKGLRFSVHITSVMCMQTQRDAFLTSIAKFTSLHSAADMKQKNIDSMKAIISIAIEDGNYLQEAWEHVLTCLSRFEHLHLLGEGVPTDASFLTVPLIESEEKTKKSTSVLSSKKTNALQNPAVMAAVRGGTYDSTVAKGSASALVTPEQINNFLSSINLLDQIGIVELNHIFAHSQRLNSDAIVAFVKALCKVSMTELQSPTDPRIFCLTKIVEIAHYNMNRIRLRSNAPEVRELIVRCVSQMVLSRVNNIKSGWKGVFMVFTSAAADDTRSTVLLAFETVEKIVRDYFHHITETETTTFTDCVTCLIAFTSSQFNSDANLNAIAFLRFCAVKLAEEGFACQDRAFEQPRNSAMVCGGNATVQKDGHISLWVPLLAGLAKLTTDPRLTIKKELGRTASIVTFFIRSPYKHCATIGVSAIMRLAEGVGNKLSKEEWKEILILFRESVTHTFIMFSKIVRMMQDIDIPDRIDSYSETEQYLDHEMYGNDEEEANMETTSYAIVKLKNHMALLLMVIQNIIKLYEEHSKYLHAEHISILLEMMSAIATHSSEVSSESSLQMKFHKACSLLEVSEPAIVHFENESYQSYLKLLQALQHDYPSLSEEMNIESQVLDTCEQILRTYLKCTGHKPYDETSQRNPSLHCAVPLSAAKKEELAARTPLVLQVMKLLGNLERDSFSRILPCFFPLLVDLIRCEHSSGEVQHALYNIFQSAILPMIRVE